jgi:hypothetical protein
MLLSSSAAGFDGRTAGDEILLGFHYGDMSNHEGRNDTDHPLNVWPYLEDYLKYLEADMSKTSYANFWRWWYILERYKGDEKGLSYLDGLVDELLKRGIKTKIDLCWSTWWDLDVDWEKGAKLSVASQDQDEWVHLCDLLARRYRGRIAHWDLQGEANNLEGYWLGKPMEYVHHNYQLGYWAFKRVDPEIRIGISGASPSVSRQKMDEWYLSNLTACKGCYDSIPINFFADIKGADPYEGGTNFYLAIRKMLEQTGQKHVEIGMGEASVQWAETTETAGSGSPPLSMEKQAERLNQTLGGMSDLGMNKFILWATEFAPGGGHWAWRWGWRNYEDWWGIWPEQYKVPGTQIVYRYDSPKGRTVDLRSCWPRPADPYYPAWEVFCFWAQSAPPGAEAVRLPMTVEGLRAEIWKIGSFQRANNRVVGLIYNSVPGSAHVKVDLSCTGWAPGTPLKVRAGGDQISLLTGEHTPLWDNTWDLQVSSKGEMALALDRLEGFTTVKIEPAAPEQKVELLDVITPQETEVGEAIQAVVVLRNGGRDPWQDGRLRLCSYDEGLGGKTPSSDPTRGTLKSSVKAGEPALISASLPAQQSPGRANFNLRLRDQKRGWMGPMFTVSVKIADKSAPRKLVAHRENGHIRLKWFAPVKTIGPVTYEIERADGFEQPFKFLTTSTATEHVDASVQPDKAYYYRIIAIDQKKCRSRPSNEDNARGLSQPRLYDAEIISQDIPPETRIGDPLNVTVTLRNTGSKAWDLSRPEELRFWLQTAQLWGRQDDEHLPQYGLGNQPSVAPGETVTISFPYVGPRPGCFENHWVLRMAVPTKGRTTGWDEKVRQAWFGTPLLAETVVKPK